MAVMSLLGFLQYVQENKVLFHVSNHWSHASTSLNYKVDAEHQTKQTYACDGSGDSRTPFGRSRGSGVLMERWHRSFLFLFGVLPKRTV
jgi:hypothetical protein